MHPYASAAVLCRKLYLMEPLCQTQMPAGGHDSSELLQRLEAQETKVLESEQRCRKALSDLQKVVLTLKSARLIPFMNVRVKNVDKHSKMIAARYENN